MTERKIPGEILLSELKTRQFNLTDKPLDLLTEDTKEIQQVEDTQILNHLQSETAGGLHTLPPPDAPTVALDIALLLHDIYPIAANDPRNWSFFNSSNLNFEPEFNIQFTPLPPPGASYQIHFRIQPRFNITLAIVHTVGGSSPQIPTTLNNDCRDDFIGWLSLVFGTPKGHHPRGASP